MSNQQSYSAYDKSHKSIRSIRKILGESINDMQYYQIRLGEIDSKRNVINLHLKDPKLSEQEKNELQNELNNIDAAYIRIVNKWNKTANKGGKTKKQRKHKKGKTAKKQKRSS